MTNDFEIVRRVLGDRMTPWTSAEYRLAREALDRIEAERDRYRERRSLLDAYNARYGKYCGDVPHRDDIMAILDGTPGSEAVEIIRRAALEGRDQG